MTPDEVLEALKAIILQRLGLLTRQEQMTVVMDLYLWLNDLDSGIQAGASIEPAGTEPSA